MKKKILNFKTLRTFEFTLPDMGQCSEIGCSDAARVKGRCKKHDQAIRRTERREKIKLKTI